MLFPQYLLLLVWRPPWLQSFPEELIVRVRRYFRNYYSVRTIFSERDMLGKVRATTVCTLSKP